MSLSSRGEEVVRGGGVVTIGGSVSVGIGEVERSRFMEASWVAASNRLQLWLYLKLFKLDVGGTRLDLGHHKPDRGCSLQKRNVLSYMGFTNLDPTYYKYGVYTSWRKGFEGFSSNRDKEYQIIGNNASKMFNGFCAISAIVACNSAGIIPEIQSTLRMPAVENMRKALHLQFSVGLAFYYGVSIAGYWSYGSSVSEYLPENITGPTWAKVIINLVVFTQSVISQHVFIAPVHEALDTKFLILDKGIHSRENIIRLLCLRALLFTLNTLVAAALPFMGDFVNLLGSFLLIPLTFVFPSMIFIKVKRESAKIKKLWHLAIIMVFSLLTMITTVAAVRLIVKNISKYYLFADT
ncbi:hypothetical protein E3N88_15395 [Mikania micrantha]|uniref:Amino acid transporter transmembrane domain-containing protein n=1 Tax=Mikania micrantha TaxID=192012 RepID=A0A5N6NYG8_9ASTR|nr:hypothetical protein E3N88_15395 [Mikania micrantha]